MKKHKERFEPFTEIKFNEKDILLITHGESVYYPKNFGEKKPRTFTVRFTRKKKP